MPRLATSFYLGNDVVALSRALLGKLLCTRSGGSELTGGVIVETEAYAGPEDRASHAHGNRCTRRTAVMFQRGGVAYVFLCYGMHALFNVVTNVEGIPHAVLIRAIQPVRGVATMLRRRDRTHLDRAVAGGPGALSQALGITVADTGADLVRGRTIWIEDAPAVAPADIIASPRVGVAYAGEHAGRPWRFRIRNSPWTSPA